MARPSLTKFHLLFLVVMGVLGGTDAAPTIIVHPTEIERGLSQALDVNCTFSLADEDNIGGIISLIIARANSSGQDFTELVAINEFSPKAPNLLTSEIVTATGFIDPASSSYLRLHWEHPTQHQSGDYRCSVQAIDNVGHNIVMEAAASVTMDEPDLADFLDQIREMDGYLQDLRNQVSDMGKQMRTLQHNMSTMASYANGLEQKLSDLENVRQNSLIEMFVQPPLVYRNSKYYVSKDRFYDVYETIPMCKMYGGYLIVVDDQEEYQALQEYAKTLAGFSWILLAGSDEATENTWVLQSNNQPVPFVEWLSGEPGGQRTENCMFLNAPAWQMNDNKCRFSPPDSTIRFACELPQ